MNEKYIVKLKTKPCIDCIVYVYPKYVIEVIDTLPRYFLKEKSRGNAPGVGRKPNGLTLDLEQQVELVCKVPYSRKW